MLWLFRPTRLSDEHSCVMRSVKARLLLVDTTSTTATASFVSRLMMGIPKEALIRHFFAWLTLGYSPGVYSVTSGVISGLCGGAQIGESHMHVHLSEEFSRFEQEKGVVPTGAHVIAA